MQHAQAVGGEVLQASQIISAAFDKQRVVLAIAEHAKQPGVGDLQVLLQPVANEMMAAGQLADDRRSSAFQQFKVVAESMNGLSWLAYTGPSCGEGASTKTMQPAVRRAPARRLCSASLLLCAAWACRCMAT